jgi:predicted N-formylglutamate amidohydrolase
VVYQTWSGEVSLNDFLITCEHGGNRIPAAYRSLFHGHRNLLNSHNGHDPGALTMARSLALALNAPLVAATVSRLLIDLNRPVGHPQLYSEITRNAPADIRAEIASRYHRPYHEKVERLVGESVSRGRRVIHISSHSFTTELNGRVRRADVGLLYDPGRRGEAELCARWKETLADVAPEFRVRRNYPYEGRSAGLTAQLRRKHPASTYVGIELEINQGIVCAAGPSWIRLRRIVSRSLLAAITSSSGEQ